MARRRPRRFRRRPRPNRLPLPPEPPPPLAHRGREPRLLRHALRSRPSPPGRATSARPGPRRTPRPPPRRRTLARHAAEGRARPLPPPPPPAAFARRTLRLPRRGYGRRTPRPPRRAPPGRPRPARQQPPGRGPRRPHRRRPLPRTRPRRPPRCGPGRPGRHPVSAARIAWAVLGREALLAMGFYALLVIVIFSFAFSADADLTLRAGGSLLWVAILFAAMVALDRAFLRESAEATLSGLQTTPAPGAAILAGKFGSSFLLICAVEAVLLPLFAVLFNAPAHTRWGGIILTALLGTWALAANGTYFSALSLHSRQRGLLLPLLLLPVAIPAILAMVQATQVFLGGPGVANYWCRLLIGYDIIYTALGLGLADLVLEVE